MFREEGQKNKQGTEGTDESRQESGIRSHAESSWVEVSKPQRQ